MASPLDFEVVFRASPSALVLVDRDSKIVAVNEAFLDFTHTQGQDLRGRALFEVFPDEPEASDPPQEALLRTTLETTFARGVRQVLPVVACRIRTCRGWEPRLWSATQVPLFGRDGGVEFVLQELVDVTEVERAHLIRLAKDDPSRKKEAGILERARLVQERNRALDNKLHELRDLFDQAPGFMCFLRGPKLMLDMANTAFFRLVGHRNIVGKPVREALPELASQANTLEKLEEVTQSGEPYVGRGVRVEFQRTADGRPVERFVDFIYQPIVDELGKRLGVMVLGFDITQQKRTEEELRRSEARLLTLMEASGAGTWEVIRETGKVRLDARARELLGTTREVYASIEALLERVHPDDRGLLRRAIRRALEADADGRYLVELRVNVPEGRPERWVEARGRATYSGSGVPSLFEGTIIDITERMELLRRERASRAEAERANRLKDEFLASVSHELRTPLTAILGWLHLLRNNSLPPEKHARALEVIERNARSQAQVIEDLLDVGRIVSGKLGIDAEPTDLARTAAMAVESVRPLADAKGVRIDASFGPGRCTVLGDPHRLQQITWNLLSNAVKFTPKGGQVWIAVERMDDCVEIRVRDTGVGIATEFLPAVFERFRQAEGGTKRKMGGLGLGLSIVRALVEAHGGEVRAYSEGAGKGALFMARIPALPGAEVTLRREPGGRGALAREIEEPSLDGLHVLLVDDESDTREYLRNLLEHAHIRVSEATNARDALEALRKAKPDVLVSDIGLLGGDGNALIRRVRKLPDREGGAIPAVAVTAHVRDEDRLRAYVAGFQRYVTKPLEADDLLDALRSLRRGYRRVGPG